MRLQQMILALGLTTLAGCASPASIGVEASETLPPAGLHPLNARQAGIVQVAEPLRASLGPTGGAAPAGLGVGLPPLASPSPVVEPASPRPVAEPPSLRNLPPVALQPLPRLGDNPSFNLPPLSVTASPAPTVPQPVTTAPPSAFWQTLRN